MSDAVPPTTPQDQSVSAPRRPWLTPRVSELPKLTDLTLLSPIGGGGGIGGSTVFGLLLAVGLLFGVGACSDDIVRPSVGALASTTAVQTISCRATVATLAVTCAGPALAPGEEILGGQGTRVALRSTNVAYNPGTNKFTFNVTVQNLSIQTLGTDGTHLTGVQVFFQNPPAATSGTGSITVDNASLGSFTGVGQQYYFYPDSLQADSISGPVTWQFGVPATVSTFAFTVLVDVIVPEVGGVLTWSAVPQFTSDSLTGIAVNSSTDAMAVGLYGRVLHKVGTQWNDLSRQINEDWIGVEAIGNGQYIGATSQGTVALYSAGTWRVLHRVTMQPYGLYAESAKRIMLGGVNRLIWWNENGDSVDLAGGGASGSYNFLVKDTLPGTTVVGSTDGTICQIAWLVQAVSNCGALAEPITAFAGSTGLHLQPLLARYTSSHGSMFDLYNGTAYVSGAPDSSIDAIVYSAGGVGASFWRATRSHTTDSTTLSSWSGSWTDRDSIPAQVLALVDDSAGGLYALSAGGIRRWNGSAVVDEVVAPAADSLTAVWGNATTAFVGTQSGNVWRYSGGGWTSTPFGSGFPIKAIQGFSASSALATDVYGNVLQFDGSTWSHFSNVDGPQALWGTDPHNMVALTWNNLGAGVSYVSRGDLSAPVHDLDPAGVTSRLNAIWGTSILDFWVVGDSGVVLHYDGSTYTTFFPPGITENLVSVSGTGNSDLWVGGANGFVGHWDGSTWASLGDIALSPVTGLWASTDSTAYVGLNNGQILVIYLGGSFTAQALPSAQGPVRSIKGTSNNGLWAIVGNGLFRGQR
ncbi:MAG: hypothetical protein WBC97_10125 [Gemmatimonadales bacterium]